MIIETIETPNGLRCKVISDFAKEKKYKKQEDVLANSLKFAKANLKSEFLWAKVTTSPDNTCEITFMAVSESSMAALRASRVSLLSSCSLEDSEGKWILV